MRVNFVLWGALMAAACSPFALESNSTGPGNLQTDNQAAPKQARCKGDAVIYNSTRALVPDGEVARRLASVYFANHYPDLKTEIRDGWVTTTELKDGVWYVSIGPGPGAMGGGPNIEICRSNGEVLNVYVTQ